MPAKLDKGAPLTATRAYAKASRLQRLQWRIEQGALLAGFWLLRRMAPDRASAFTGWLLARTGPWLSRHRRALQHLEMVFPEKSQAERDRIVRGMWRSMGRIAGEYAHLESILTDPERVTVVGLEKLRAALGEKKAALMVSAHYGNWEVTTIVGRALGLAQANLYRPVDNPWADQLLRQVRGPSSGAGLIPKGQGNLREMMRMLQRGTSIGLLVDQRESRGVRLPFLGHEAWTVHTPALLARRLGTPLFIGRATRLQGARFLVEVDVVPIDETEDWEADALEATRWINDRLSAWIIEHPEQWFWFHKRWAS